MPFPLDLVTIDQRKSEVEKKKYEVFDEVLSDLIATRIMVEACVYDYETKKVVSNIVKANLEKKLNPTLIEIVFSSNELHFHDCARPPKPWQVAVRNHDMIEKNLRDLVKFAYANDIGKDVVRKKVVGCTNAVLLYVNSVNFIQYLCGSDARNYIKGHFLKTRKKK